MKKYNCIMLFLITNCIFGQNGNKSEFDYKIRFDSINKNDVYYEKIDLSNENMFNDDNYQVIKERIISNNKGFKRIINGLVAEEVIYKKIESQTINYIYDENSILSYKIYCIENKLSKVEKIKDSKIGLVYSFGLNESKISYVYYDWGYFMTEEFNGQVLKYKVEIKNGKEIKKALTEKLHQESVIVSDNENIVINDNDSNLIYQKFSSYCIK